MATPSQRNETRIVNPYVYNTATGKSEAWDGQVIIASSLIPEEYDYIALTYVTVGNGIGEIETATYKTGGAGGTTVATLTLTYDASNRIASVTRT